MEISQWGLPEESSRIHNTIQKKGVFEFTRDVNIFILILIKIMYLEYNSNLNYSWV